MKLDPVKLVKHRERLGYSQQNVADKSRVNVRTISRAEGGFSVSSESAASIAAALETTPQALLAEGRSPDTHVPLGGAFTLHRVKSGRAIIDALDRGAMCKIECDVEPTRENLDLLKSLANLLETNMPEPFNALKLSWPPSRTLAERLDLIAEVNEAIAALDAIGVGVFLGTTWLHAYLPSYYYETGFYYPDEAESSGCSAARIVISEHSGEKIARSLHVAWPVKIDKDFGDEVPF